MLDKLSRSKFFRNLDLAKAFHQFKKDPADPNTTIFLVKMEIYVFKRMSFGLKNSPSTFKRIIDNSSRRLQGFINRIYEDNIDVIVVSGHSFRNIIRDFN